MLEEDIEIAIKVVIVGNGGVGKSSMIQRYCKGIFTKDYKKTIGVDFLEREMEYDGEEIRLMLWDTAGQEEFDAITKAYYRGAQACVLAYSVTDRASFDAVRNWKRKVEAEVGEIPMVLVQNKMDLTDEYTLTEECTEELAKDLRLRVYKTSVKENLNVEAVFEYLTERYLTDMNSKEEEIRQTTTIGAGILSQSSLSQHYDRNTASISLRATASTSSNNIHSSIHHDNRASGNQSNSHSQGRRKKEKCALL